MYDTAVAFTKWCNEHGGSLGRELVLCVVDVKLFDYEPGVSQACDRDFALVGGGAVFDDDPTAFGSGAACRTSPATSSQRRHGWPTCRCSPSRTRYTT